MAQLSCVNLTLGYEGKSILSGINFEVNAGDYLCILGENGSGKSTLMKTLLGLHSPMGGTIKTEIGYLPQQTVVQRDFPASVREIVISGCQGKCGIRPFYNKAEKALAENNMKRLGIENLAKRCYRELSGGQQQRVSIGRALMNNPALLLADEPTGALDSKTSAEIMELFKKLNAQGRIVVIVTHDGEIAQQCGRVIEISDGKVQ